MPNDIFHFPYTKWERNLFLAQPTWRVISPLHFRHFTS